MLYTNMKLPKSFKEITVRQYQVVCDLLINKKIDQLDKEVAIIAALSGKTVAEIEALPLDKLRKAILLTSFLSTPNITTEFKKYVVVKGRVYKAIPFAQKLTAGQYVSLKAFCAMGNNVEQMNNLLACVYQRVRMFKKFDFNNDEHEQCAKDMLDVKVSDVYGTLFFYSEVWKSWNQVILDYSESASKTIKEAIQEMKESSLMTPKDLENIGVGLL